MNIKAIIGLILGFMIGLGCSLLNIPVPAPPVLVGALLVVAMTAGYSLTDRYLCVNRPKSQEVNCAGSTGETRQKSNEEGSDQ